MIHLAVSFSLFLSAFLYSSMIFAHSEPKLEAYVLYNTSTNSVTQVDVSSLVVSQLSFPAGPHYGGLVSADQKYVYSTNYLANSVSKIDQSTFVLEESIPVGLQPWGMAMTRDGTTAVVANSGDGTVSIIDLTNFAVTHTVAVGQGPRNVVITNDGQVLITNFIDNTISYFYLNPLSLSISVDVGEKPIGIALGPTQTGTEVYITHLNQNYLTTMDVQTHFPAAIPAPQTGLEGIAISADGTTAWVTSGVTGYNYVYAIDLGEGHLVHTIGVDGLSHAIMLSSDGLKAFVATTSGTFVVIDTNNWTVSNTAPIDQNGTGLLLGMRHITSTRPDRVKKIRGPICQKDKKYYYDVHAKWNKSSSTDVTSYRIYSHHKRIRTITHSAQLKAHLLFYRKVRSKQDISRSFIRALERRFTIRAVNDLGETSRSTHLQIRK